MKIFHTHETIAVWEWHVRQLAEYRGRVHLEDRERVWREWDAVLLAPGPYRTVFRTAEPDGSVRWFMAQASPILDAAGMPGFLVGRIEDVTDRERSRQEFEDFVHAAGHDLKEPLRAVSSFSQLLARTAQGQLSVETEQYLAFILDGAKRMRALVDGLLALSRSGSPLRPESVDCATIVAACGVTEVTFGPLPVIQADPAKLTSLFQQLLSNSVRFRRPDVPLRIEIQARRTDLGEWEFSVQDNGQGFDPKHAEVVFAPFRRLHGHDLSGAGLGLAICRKIVEQHGGRIRAEPRLNGGVTFRFTLPAATAL